MKFWKRECKVLYLHRIIHALGANKRENRFSEKNLRVMGDKNLNMSQQCAHVAKKADSILTCILTWTNIASRLREVVLPPYSAPLRHICSAGFAGFPDTRESETYWSKFFEGQWGCWRPQSIYHMKRGSDSLGYHLKNRPGGGLIHMQKYLIEGRKEDGASLFSVVQWKDEG